jgi:hypothetical protein
MKHTLLEREINKTSPQHTKMRTELKSPSTASEVCDVHYLSPFELDMLLIKRIDVKGFVTLINYNKQNKQISNKQTNK